MLDNQKELFIVVDKDDNVLEYRTRYDCHHDKSLIHRAVGIIIYNDNDEILLQKRSMLKDLHPGKFTLSASGHVTKGQTYDEAAMREMQEEIGIQTKITSLKKIYGESEEETEIDMIYTAKYNGPFRIAKDEVEYVKFFTVEEIKQMQDQLAPFALLTLQKIGILNVKK